MPDMIYIDEFRKIDGCYEPLDILLVIKSVDQMERRKRLLDQFKSGTIGRIKPRPISEGLLVKCQLSSGGDGTITADNAEYVRTFPEPRHIVAYGSDRFLLTEIGRVDLLDEEGRVLDVIFHPYFAFLHTLTLDSSHNRLLVASPGYDALLELDLKTKKEVWRWFGWEHGFNPNEEGVYFTTSKEEAEALEEKGCSARYIDPEEYNEQGLLTAARTTHPNGAIYNVYKDDSTIIVSLGRKGKIIEIDRTSGNHSLRLDTLAPMPHGILPYEGGWMVTNTTRGEVWLLDENFTTRQQIIFNRLPGKAEGISGFEWLQLVRPLTRDLFVALDANRGIIVCDVADRWYTIYHPDRNWCLQDILFLGKS
jgi:hypothetical protein